MLKILHTSDWHLGKKLYKKERHEEHVLFLEYLTHYLKEQKIEILVIAGDIFDSVTPPTKAIALFFDFLGRLEKEAPHLKKVFAIAGNHDNGALLETPKPFLNDDFFKIVGTYENKSYSNYAEIVELEEKVFIGTLPFFRPRDLFSLEITDIPYFDTLQEELLYRLEWWLKEVRGSFDINKGLPSFLIGHHLFGSFHLSGSELGVGLSGLETLPLGLFKDWDTLLLGHIHRPQTLKKQEPLAIYSGSPIPLRFSESNQKKIVEYTVEDGRISHKWVELPIFRPLLRIQSGLEEIRTHLANIEKTSPLDPYIEINFTENVPMIEIEKIRKEFSDSSFEIINFYSKNSYVSQDNDEEKINVREINLNDLFKQYLDEFEITEEEKKEIIITFNELQEGLGESDALS